MKFLFLNIIYLLTLCTVVEGQNFIPAKVIRAKLITQLCKSNNCYYLDRLEHYDQYGNLEMEEDFTNDSFPDLDIDRAKVRYCNIYENILDSKNKVIQQKKILFDKMPEITHNNKNTI